MILCALDVETTGFDPKQDRVIELAAKIYNTEEMFFPLAEVSTLVFSEQHPKLTEEIVDITGINEAMLNSEFSRHPNDVFKELADKIREHKVQAMLAHNAPFDKGFVDMELAIINEILGLPWMCTWKDIQHPAKFKCKKLSHLALDYGIAIDPKELHRATADVDLMIDMVKAAGVDFEYLFQRSQVPDVTIRACIPSPFGPGGDGGVGKDKAASLGFRWQGDRKIWTKTVKEDQLDIEKERLGYNVAII